MFTCNKCSKEFKTNFLLKRHESNKLPCDSPKKISSIYNNKLTDIDEQILNITKSIINLDDQISKIELKISKTCDKSFKNTANCFFCNKTFSTKQNTYRHITDYCVSYKLLIEEKNKLKK